MEGGSNYETLFVCICTGQLSPDDLALVYEEVMSARSKWYIIGLELGLKVDGLEIIEVNNLYSNKSCLMECLQVWLRGSRPPPTWSAMVTALRSPTVGFEDLADVIEKKYRIKRGNTEGKESIISSLQVFINGYLHTPSLSNSHHIIVY